MKLHAFKPFFSLQEPAWSSQAMYGLNYFYNRSRTHLDWESFSVIKTATAGTGEVILGQIPILSLHKPLIKKLAKQGMVVSCTDHFELSGVGALSSTIPPYTWAYHNIDHQHLPFTDAANNVDPILILQTLQKMLFVHQNNGAIYIHCKAGRSQSALLAALFLCITDERLQQQLIKCRNKNEIAVILKNTTESLKVLRTQVSVAPAQLALGVEVLKHYVTYWKDAHPEQHLFNVVANPNDKLKAYQALSVIAQSDEYKFVWDQAYKNPKIFPLIKRFAEDMYQQVEINKEDEFIIDELIVSVLRNMPEKDSEVIAHIHFLYIASEEFMKQMNQYSESIQSLGLDLLNKILKSNLTYKEKTNWLKKTTILLNNLNDETIKKYNSEIQAALKHPSLTLQIIGGAMMALGAAVVMVSLIAGFLASGGVLGIILATVGAGAFGAFEFAIGKLVYDHGVSHKIAKTSHALINKIVEGEPTPEELIDLTPSCQ